MSANPDLEAAAGLFDGAAAELELAAEHCRTAAGHLRAEEVPRGAAHAWAALGHLDEAEGLLREQARMHARKSNPEVVRPPARSHALVTKPSQSRRKFARTLQAGGSGGTRLSGVSLEAVGCRPAFRSADASCRRPF